MVQDPSKESLHYEQVTSNIPVVWVFIVPSLVNSVSLIVEPTQITIIIIYS